MKRSAKLNTLVQNYQVCALSERYNLCYNINKCHIMAKYTDYL
jgi:hypothetical protein